MCKRKKYGKIRVRKIVAPGGKMAEKRIKNIKSELPRELIGMYQPQSVGDIADMLKDLFAGTIVDMSQAELLFFDPW